METTEQNKNQANQSDTWNERVKSLMRSLISAYNSKSWDETMKHKHTTKYKTTEK